SARFVDGCIPLSTVLCVGATRRLRAGKLRAGRRRAGSANARRRTRGLEQLWNARALRVFVALVQFGVVSGGLGGPLGQGGGSRALRGRDFARRNGRARQRRGATLWTRW